jgi:hypothetical protein
MRYVPRLSLRRFLLLGLAVVGASLVSATLSSAAHPFVAGEPSTQAVTLAADASVRALARAAAVGRALGLPAGAQAVQRIDDRFEHATYDEITTSDGRGRPVSIVRLGIDGRVSLAVGLGLHAAGRATDAAGAIRSATGAALAAGIEARGTPTAARSQAAGGWRVTWPRIVDGALVRGDGVRVAIWSDGSFHSISRTEHALAARPSAVASEAQARSAAGTFAAVRFGSAAASLQPVGASLVWVAPNDTWDAARPDAPDAVARLAWVVEYRATGALADRLIAIEVWLDAGSLAVIGGDVAE